MDGEEGRKRTATGKKSKKTTKDKTHMGGSCWPRDVLRRPQIRGLSRETRWIGARYTPTDRQLQSSANAGSSQQAR